MAINKRDLCRAANLMTKEEGMSRSEAFRAAWRLAKAKLVEKVSGVTFGRRQEALQRLTRYDAQEIGLQLRREQDNAADMNAVAVWASVAGRGEYHMGFLPRTTAARLAPIMDKGVRVRTALEAIVGGYEGLSYGIRVRMAV